jgi:threonine aldolase
MSRKQFLSDNVASVHPVVGRYARRRRGVDAPYTATRCPSEWMLPFRNYSGVNALRFGIMTGTAANCLAARHDGSAAWR